MAHHERLIGDVMAFDRQPLAHQDAAELARKIVEPAPDDTPALPSYKPGT